QPPEMPVELVVRVLTDAARVEDDDVRVLELLGRLHPLRSEEPGDPLRVVLVHLASVGADVEAARHARSLRVPRAGPPSWCSEAGAFVGVDGREIDGRRRILLDTEPDLLADLLADLHHEVQVLGQELLRVLAALTELLAFVGEPRSRLLDD